MCIMAFYDKKDCVNEKTHIFTPELWRFACLIFGRGLVKQKVMMGR